METTTTSGDAAFDVNASTIATIRVWKRDDSVANVTVFSRANGNLRPAWHGEVNWPMAAKDLDYVSAGVPAAVMGALLDVLGEQPGEGRR
jgi:hypothetical protein